MMKFIFMIIFMSCMIIFHKKNMFYYNLSYFISFMFLFKFLFKDGVWISLSLIFGYDFYSFFLLILSMWIMGLMFMVIQKDSEESSENYKEKFMVFMIMFLILMMFFSSLNLMLFYLLFELSLLPTFIMIVYWGINFERLSASYYLLMYTMFISLPLFIYIMKLYQLNNTLDLNMLGLYMKMNFNFGLWDYLILFLAFYIKMPMFMFHVWLPKAHVEAPVYGSMILAAVLLKLGGYGLLRFMEMFLYKSVEFNYLVFSICVIGSVAVSFVCLVQIDMKSLVAYSSVVHMNMVMCSILTLMKLGFISALITMIAHGLCSSGLFYMVNLYYERTHSRVMFFNKGMMNLMPSLSMGWFILCMANFSYPFSLNFVGEIFMISVIISWDINLMILMMIICFFSSAYSLYLYSYVQHGKEFYKSSLNIISVKELVLLVVHIYPLMAYMLNLTMLF